MLEYGFRIGGHSKVHGDLECCLLLILIEHVMRCREDVDAIVDQKCDRFWNAGFGGVMQDRCVITDNPDTRSKALPGNTSLQIHTVSYQQFDDLRELHCALDDRVTGAALEIVNIDLVVFNEMPADFKMALCRRLTQQALKDQVCS